MRVNKTHSDKNSQLLTWIKNVVH